LLHRSIWTLLAIAVAGGEAAAKPLLVLDGAHRRELTSESRGDTEAVELGPLVQGLGVTVATDPVAGKATLACQGREVVLFHKKNLISINGDLRLLSGPLLLDSGRWYVPLESVSKLLGPLLNQTIVWRSAQRVLLIGDVRLPRVTLTSEIGADRARIVLHSTEKIPFQVKQGEGLIVVDMPAEALDVAFQSERLTGGIVEAIELRGGPANTVAILVGPRFRGVRAQEFDEPPRMVLDIEAAPLATVPTPSAAPTPTGGTQSAESRPRWSLRTIVIDPGHGGDEVGALGPAGTLEKEVTLAIGRKLRSALASRLGVQVFLTREGDQALTLDERAAIANNYKADVFLSIHANASRSHGARGSEVYFLSYHPTDEESRRVALVEGSMAAGADPALPGSDLNLVLWDMAQADHLEESSELAARLQEGLAGVTGSEGRGVKQAPFRVLVGATMAAVLLEVAFISHPEEEKLLISDAYQTKVVGAIVDGIVRYGRERAQRLDPRSATWTLHR
jgi:N-acetylmuramoyl-L-alanine amidase